MLPAAVYINMREFYEDIREKKRAAVGVFSRKGKRGYVGKMLTTVDLLQGKAKREYTKGSRIKLSNMYEEIKSKDDLYALSEKQQAQAVSYLRKNYSLKEIEDKFGVSNYHLYKLIDKHKLPKEERVNTTKQKPAAKKSNTKQQAVDDTNKYYDIENKIIQYKEQIEKQKEEIAQLNALIDLKPQEKEPAEDGMQYKINGIFDAEQLIKKLEKFTIILEDEPNKFNIELNIKELIEEANDEQEQEKERAAATTIQSGAAEQQTETRGARQGFERVINAG